MVEYFLIMNVAYLPPFSWYVSEWMAQETVIITCKFSIISKGDYVELLCGYVLK